MVIFIRFLPVIYLVLINIAAFIVYGVDKRRAERYLWRIPEKVLILLAVFGGSIGALMGCGHFIIKHASGISALEFPAF